MSPSVVGSSSSSEERLTFGSLRIKANVSEAKVYVDGALAGLVDEFDGLKDHLELETGKHTVELRAEGYATVSADVVMLQGQDEDRPGRAEEGRRRDQVSAVGMTRRRYRRRARTTNRK